MKWISLTLVMLCLVFASCKGGQKCGPGSSPLSDADSDCVADESDNCPLSYNPAQSDGDEDGVGAECDSNDADDTVAVSINSTESLLYTFYPIPEESEIIEKDCSPYVIDCNQDYLGELNDDLLDVLELDQTSNCSAFNREASLPPALFCDDDHVGYLRLSEEE